MRWSAEHPDIDREAMVDLLTAFTLAGLLEVAKGPLARVDRPIGGVSS